MTEHLTTTLTIEGLTGDPHTDPDVILDKAGDDSSTEKARLEALSWALERYNTSPGTDYAAPRLHEAALDPTATGARLDAWARAHVPGTRDDAHPVTGHLPPLTKC